MKSFSNSLLQHGFIREYLAGLDCPRSLAIWMLYDSGEHQQLVDLEFDPQYYEGIEHGRDALAATKLLSKADFLDLNIDRKKIAMEKFYAAESQCAETNRRVIRSNFNSLETNSIMVMAVGFIGRVLGDFCPDEFADSCAFGPGASTRLPRRDATLPMKYGSKCHISSMAYDFVKDWWRSAYPLWECDFAIQDFSKIVTVPKNAKTDRTIAVEPDINLWLQKGIGLMLRKRLLRKGLDLNTQEHNQRSARLASKYNKLATVDFSAASDTISTAVVRELLPERWFVLMDCTRSRFGCHEGNVFPYQKFSSMGNGFTFELESLIFWALATCCTRYLGLSLRGLTVFGDDIVLPSEALPLFRTVCTDLGFTINAEKTYDSTPYRESCGAHYWNGRDIKPIFLKEPLIGKAQVVRTANNVRRLAHRRNSYGCDARLRSCYEILVQPLSGIARISDGYGDDGLIENIDHPKVVYQRSKHGIEGYYVRIWVPVAVMKFYECRGLLLSKLKTIGDTPDQDMRPDLKGIGNDIPLPCRSKQTRVRLLMPRWRDLGPWL